MSSSPWIDEIPPLTDEEILAGIESIPEPILELGRLKPIEARQRLERALESAVVVTDRVLVTIRHLYDTIRVDSVLRYPSAKDYFSWLQTNQFPMTSVAPICFTGLAGVGKSKSLKLLNNLLRYRAAMFEADVGVPLAWTAYLHLEVGARTSGAALVDAAQYKLGRNKIKGTTSKKFDWFQEDGYRRGLLAVALDEMQHLTLSHEANTKATSLLLSFRATGIPLIYGCNYSLLHRLMKRNQEDRDRLLRNLIVMNPYLPTDHGWQKLVESALLIAPDAFRVDSSTDAAELGELTACLPRMLHLLLCVAYMRARERRRPCADMDDIDAAYKSPAFGVMRLSIEGIRNHCLTGKIVRPDLCLPPELRDIAEAQEARLAAVRAQNKAIRQKIQEGALTVGERATIERLKRAKRSSKSLGTSRQLRNDGPSDEEVRAGLDYLGSGRR